jgi:hypothetical protein
MSSGYSVYFQGFQINLWISLACVLPVSFLFGGLNGIGLRTHYGTRRLSFLSSRFYLNAAPSGSSKLGVKIM